MTRSLYDRPSEDTRVVPGRIGPPGSGDFRWTPIWCLPGQPDEIRWSTGRHQIGVTPVTGRRESADTTRVSAYAESKRATLARHQRGVYCTDAELSRHYLVVSSDVLVGLVLCAQPQSDLPVLERQSLRRNHS